MSEPICPTCKQERPKGWLRSMRKRQGQRISEALKNAEHVGRRRVTDFEAVKTARKKGLSLSQLATLFNVSRGAIQNALRLEKI